MKLRHAILSLWVITTVGCSLLLDPLVRPRDAGSNDDADSDQLEETDSDTKPDATSDADRDSPPDSDAPEDADGEVIDCPMNSGAYCLCDKPWTDLCDDGSFCLTVANLGEPGELGYCAPECDCSQYPAPCEDSPYRAEPRCILINNWPITTYTICNCVLIHCNINADCPPEQTCQLVEGTHGEYDGVEVSICSPPSR